MVFINWWDRSYMFSIIAFMLFNPTSVFANRDVLLQSSNVYKAWHGVFLLKGLRKFARGLWRSEARRVEHWSETLHEPYLPWQNPKCPWSPQCTGNPSFYHNWTNHLHNLHEASPYTHYMQVVFPDVLAKSRTPDAATPIFEMDRGSKR